MVVLQPIIKVLLFFSIIALQLSRESYTGLSLSTIIDVRDEHPSKQLPVKLATEEGM